MDQLNMIFSFLKHTIVSIVEVCQSNWLLAFAFWTLVLSIFVYSLLLFIHPDN